MDARELLKMISYLLQYPDDELYSIDWKSALSDIEETEISNLLMNFISYYSRASLHQLQEVYVSTFDFNDKNSLYFSYILYGDERKRGQFLAELKQLYEDSGMELSTTELPDYLPLFLEFLSWTEASISATIFQNFKKGAEKTGQSLTTSKSPYAGLFKALFHILDHFKLKEVLS